MRDVGDWVGYNTAEAIARRERRKRSVWEKRAELIANFDVIHGHFIADKYLGFTSEMDFIAFFREPYQQIVSAFEYVLRNPQQVDHPAVAAFHEQSMSLMDFVTWEDRGNVQAEMLGSVPLEDLAMVGISEQFDQSVALFNATFKRDLKPNSPLNVNPDRPGSRYEVDPEILKAVKRYRAEDLDVYRRACELFEAQCARRL